MPERIIASKIFTEVDQQAFAAASGDVNPMHMDGVFARRTFSGFAVVHGIHMVLWALEQATQQVPLTRVGRLRVTFSKPVNVGEAVTLSIHRRDDHNFSLKLTCNDVLVSTVQFGIGTVNQELSTLPSAGADVSETDLPRDVTFDNLLGGAGFLPFVQASSGLVKDFPMLAHQMGAHGLQTLACLSRLVGMVCPGLHSVFSAIDLVSTSTVGRDGVAFEVVEADERFRRAVLSVSGPSFRGKISAYAPKPALQPSCQEIRHTLDGADFTGKRCVIVGGSRGLGETTAKIVAMGGGEAIITYATGKADAEHVQLQIVDAGGRCSILRLDVLEPLDQQLVELDVAIDAVFFFATPTTYRKSNSLFDKALHERFLSYYTNAFYEVCTALNKRAPLGLVAFYPSTVFVDKRPRGMIEYAMAKAAGEVMCAELDRYGTGIRTVVNRLPKLPTDLSASLIQVETAPVLETLLPIVNEVLHGGKLQRKNV